MQDIIDIKSLYETICKSKISIALIITLTIVLMVVYLWFVAKPVYESETQILVNQAEKESNLQEQAVQANLKLIDTYSAIIMSPRILNLVEKDLNGKFTKEELSRALQVKSSTNSQLLTIKAQSGDAKLATEIANKAAKVFKKEIPKIMKVDNVTILSHSTIPEQPIKPNKSLMLCISFLLGIIVTFIFILFKTLLDRTIKREEYLHDVLGLNILGSISDFKRQEK